MTVDGYASQIEAIRHGLGIGYVPAHLVREDVRCGRLVTKVVARSPTLRVAAAWRETPVGRGLRWFLDRLGDAAVRARLIPPSA
jgi:DNA-binding transcriptional LysR family regulator